jgi:hypothetical protein
LTYEIEDDMILSCTCQSLGELRCRVADNDDIRVDAVRYADVRSDRRNPPSEFIIEEKASLDPGGRQRHQLHGDATRRHASSILCAR